MIGILVYGSNSRKELCYKAILVYHALYYVFKGIVKASVNDKIIGKYI